MILGGVFAHLSGEATWQKMAPPPALKPVSADANATPSVPKVDPSGKAEDVPKAIPITAPQAAPPPASIQGNGSSLLKPPQSGLKEQILDLPPPAR